MTAIQRTPAELTEAALVAAYRSAHPMSRAQSIIVFGLNTGCRKSRRCILCGTTGPTWSARWPQTVTAMTWEVEHKALHLAEARLALGETT